MPVATITSTSSLHHRRTQVYSSHSLNNRAYESASDLTVSDPSQSVEVVGGQRRLCAKVHKNPPEELRSRAKGAMTSHYPRRSHSDSKTTTKETRVKEPEVVVREVRRESDWEHRHHHRKSEKRDARDGERDHVYKTRRKSDEEADRSRPSNLRRSTTNAGGVSRTRHERQRAEDRLDREMRRRHSERRRSHHEEKVHTPLRHEKRSIADHAPKTTRDRAPVTR